MSRSPNADASSPVQRSYADISISEIAVPGSESRCLSHGHEPVIHEIAVNVILEDEQTKEKDYR